VQNFGEPFFLVVRENETLVDVKERIRKKLLVADEEFAKVYPFRPDRNDVRTY
jgi:ubiquitin carboxyl-terminal hydrolase 7